MDIRRVHYFCVLCNSGSLTKASELLRVSQPALSKAIRLLEDEVSLKLFTREGRGLKLTEAGRNFRTKVEPLLNEWLNIPKSLDQKSTHPVLRIGTFEVFSTHFFGILSNHLPQSGIEVLELTPGRLEDAIAEGSIDVGITYLPIPKANINFTEATQLRMGLFGKAVYQKKPIGELPFVIPNSLIEGTPSRVMGLDGWPDHKIRRRIAYKVTMMETALELCRQGKAVAYLPEFIIRLHNQTVKNEYLLTEISCPISLVDRRQSVYIINRSTAEESPLIKSIAKALRSIHWKREN